MGEPHVAFIVEDDPHIAAVEKELATALGHTALHAATLDEARRIAAQGGYCYVLLDMQIPTREGESPTAAAGEALLDEIRARAPERNEAGRHRLQIIVVTAYSRDPEYASRLLEAGADAFIAKPFGERIEVVLDKVRTCLARAGRATHAECPKEGSAEDGIRVSIGGEKNGRRSVVGIGDARCELQDALFVVFLRLAAEHLREPGAWSAGAAVGIARNKWAPTRIRAALADALPEGFAIIEADRTGRFRLHPACVVHVDWAALEKHPDAAVQKLARAAASR